MTGHRHTKNIVSRLSRIEGHVRAIRRMVESGRSCEDVLTQIAAVRAAMDKAAKVLLADHMEHCLNGTKPGANLRKSLLDLQKAIERFIV